MNYKQWLYMTCKWATLGLDGDEFNTWQELTTKLDKHCPECKEGYICEVCHNSGLNLTALEKMLVRGIEISLDTHKFDSSH